MCTRRAQSKVDDFAQPNLKNYALDFKPDRYSSKGVGSARIAPSNQPGYAGHRPGCMDYNLGMSYGAFSRHSRNVSSAKGVKVRAARACAKCARAKRRQMGGPGLGWAFPARHVMPLHAGSMGPGEGGQARPRP